MPLSTIHTTALLCATLLATAHAEKHDYPVDPSVIGKGVFANSGCSNGGGIYGQDVRIEPWGVYHRPEFNQGLDRDKEVCPEEIVAVFRKNDKMAMLYHRPRVPVGYFAKSYRDLYDRYRKGESVKFPCEEVPFVEVYVWRHRKYFVSLVQRMARGLVMIRDWKNCEGVRFPVPETRTYAEVEVLIMRHRVVDAAINYLHNLAYSNFFCIEQ